MTKIDSSTFLIGVLLGGLMGGLIAVGYMGTMPKSTDSPSEDYNISIGDKITEELFGRDIEIKAPKHRYKPKSSIHRYTSDKYERVFEGYTYTVYLMQNVCESDSMVPSISCNSTVESIGVRGSSKLLDSIQVGDIIGFKNKNISNKVIVHRIVFEGEDNEGRFFITKGDNNKYTDEGWFGKVREDDIRYLVVAIIY